jgi:hypothetical protein
MNVRCYLAMHRKPVCPGADSISIDPSLPPNYRVGNGKCRRGDSTQCRACS